MASPHQQTADYFRVPGTSVLSWKSSVQTRLQHSEAAGGEAGVACVLGLYLAARKPRGGKSKPPRNLSVWLPVQGSIIKEKIKIALIKISGSDEGFSGNLQEMKFSSLP